MELINRKTLKQRNLAPGKIMVTIYNGKMYFTRAACEMFGIEAGKYMHFINDGKEWSFIVSDDPDGFMISKEGSTKKGARINSAALTLLFKTSTKHTNLPLSFYLHSTEREYNGCKVAELLTDKPTKLIGE